MARINQNVPVAIDNSPAVEAARFRPTSVITLAEYNETPAKLRFTDNGQRYIHRGVWYKVAFRSPSAKAA